MSTRHRPAPAGQWALGCCSATGIRAERKTRLVASPSAAPRLRGRYFFVVTLPDGDITYHRPPLRLSACPAWAPGAVSAT